MLWPWLRSGLNNISQKWGRYADGSVEYGVDLAMPTGTPITSLTTGQIAAFGYYGGGGVVSVQSVVDKQPTTVYYQHLDLIVGGLFPGKVVLEGQVLGWSGGQNSGGHHPATPQYSTGPHIEVGRDAPYGGIWGRPLAPNRDPLPWLMGLAASDGGGSSFQSTNPSTGGSTAADGEAKDLSLADVCFNLDNAGYLLNPFDISSSNPLDWVGQLGTNLFRDSGALLFRLLFIILGVFLVLRVVARIVPVGAVLQPAAAEEGDLFA